MSYRWSDLVDSESFGMSPGGRNIEIPRPLIIHYSMSKRDAHKIKTSPLQEKILIFFQAISVSWSVRKTTWQYWADDESPENKRNAPIASAKTTMRNSQVYVVIFHFSGLRLRLICLVLKNVFTMYAIRRWNEHCTKFLKWKPGLLYFSGHATSSTRFFIPLHEVYLKMISLVGEKQTSMIFLKFKIFIKLSRFLIFSFKMLIFQQVYCMI